MSPRSPSFYAQAALVAGVAVIALAIAVPRLLAQAPLAASIISTSEAAAQATPGQVVRALSAAEWAVALQSGSRDNYRALANMQLLQAEKHTGAQTMEQAQALLLLAADELKTGLQQAPAAPDMWLSLARLRSLTQAPDASAIQFLENSFLTGPRENWVSEQRLEFGLAHWEQFDPSLQQMIARDLRSQTVVTLAEFALGRSAPVIELIEREVATRPEPAQKAFERARKRIDKGVL